MIVLEGLGAVFLLIALGQQIAAHRARRSREDAFKRSEHRLLEALQANPDPVVLVSLEDDKILTVNAAFERANGHRKDEAVGRTPLEIGMWPDPAERQAFLTQLHARGCVQDLECLMRPKDRPARPFRVAAMLLEVGGRRCVLGVAQDIEEEAKAAAALKRSEERFASIFNATPEAIVISSMADARILDVNPSFLALTDGASREEIIGRTAVEIGIWRHPQERQSRLEALGSAGSDQRLEMTFRREDGSEVWALLSMTQTEVEGEPCLLVIGRDITAMKRLEIECSALIEDLEKRRAELASYSYTVSHDLRSPLVTLSGFVGVLEGGASKGDLPTVEDALRRMRDASTRLGALLDDLSALAFAGRETAPVSGVDLGAVVKRVLARYGEQIVERGIEVELAEDLPRVDGDPQQLEQIYDQLISNAIKFLTSHGRPRIEIGVRHGAEERVFYVRDHGIGIPARYREKIFELFQRLDAAAEGTGVGLTLAARWVELEGGRIWVESPGPGQGSTFCWTLGHRGAQEKDTSEEGEA